ncbi:MAG: 2-deoxycytidine 5-triphosphate deaminase, partial [Marinovum sp.]|nr:2-deoxycytidine 5-triphosphate deaminase [Marinovum sp.]
MSGVLPDQSIQKMINSATITAQPPILSEQIQPASLDLRLGNTAWRVRASFLSGDERKLTDRLKNFEMHEIDLRQGAVLEKGCVYVFPLMESLDLPENIQ